MTDDVNKILSERGGTHGDFSTNTRIMQVIKREMRCEPKWDVLKDHQAEALDMIAHKIGRILAGDPNFKDHWDDIAGYAVLVANRCSQPVMQWTPEETARMKSTTKPAVQVNKTVSIPELKTGNERRCVDGSREMWTGEQWVKSDNSPITSKKLYCAQCNDCMRVNAAGYAMCQFENCPNTGKKVL